jgi:hypothetical protein
MPGFHHKFEAIDFREGEWNSVHIHMWPEWEGSNSGANTGNADCGLAVRYTVGLNDKIHEAPIEGNWVMSVQRGQRRQS